VGSGFDEDDFMSTYCHGCKYYFDEDTDDGQDDDGNSFVTITTSCCEAYRDNNLRTYHDSTCPADYEVGDPDENEFTDYELAPTCFEFYYKPSSFLEHGTITLPIETDGSRPAPNIRSYLQEVRELPEDSTPTFSTVFQNINCYASGNDICWGPHTDLPASIDQAIATFAGTPSNNDLLSLEDYKAYSLSLPFLRSTAGDYSFEYRAGADALLLLHPKLHRDAYLQLRTAGIGTIGESGMLVAFVKRATVFRNEGFTTEADALLRQWFIHRNTLIGQIPND
jgi:hypothetical protein